MHKKDGPADILHVVPQMTQGGAETVISNIIRHSDPQDIHHHVLVLGRDHSFQGEFADLPASLNYLMEMTPREQIALAREADLVHVAHRKAAFFVTPFAKILHTPVVMGVHVTPSEGNDRRVQKAVYSRAEPLIVRNASHIVCCTDKAVDNISAKGWDKSKLHVITNGIDTDEFHFSPESGKAFRASIGVPENATVVGISARFAAMKDIPNFINAAQQLKEKYRGKPIYFVFCGNHMTEANPELTAALKKAGIYEESRLLGVRNDMKNIYSGLDVLALSSSRNEALSMTLLEGTACECHIVTTDVGDHRKLMQKTGGICVPTQDSAALAEGISRYIDMPEMERLAKRVAGREAIIEHYNVRNMAAKYNQLFAETVKAAREVHVGRRI